MAVTQHCWVAIRLLLPEALGSVATNLPLFKGFRKEACDSKMLSRQRRLHVLIIYVDFTSIALISF